MTQASAQPRVQLDCGGEGLLGALHLAERRPGLAVGVMRRRELRRAPAGFARGVRARPDCRRAQDARRRRGGTARDRRGRRLRLSRTRERFGMPPRGLERDAELKLSLRVAGFSSTARLKCSIAAMMSFARSASSPRRSSPATSAVLIAGLSESRPACGDAYARTAVRTRAGPNGRSERRARRPRCVVGPAVRAAKPKPPALPGRPGP